MSSGECRPPETSYLSSGSEAHISSPEKEEKPELFNQKYSMASGEDRKPYCSDCRRRASSSAAARPWENKELLVTSAKPCCCSKRSSASLCVSSAAPRLRCKGTMPRCTT